MLGSLYYPNYTLITYNCSIVVIMSTTTTMTNNTHPILGIVSTTVKIP